MLSISDSNIDAVILSETWLHLDESAIEREVREHGYKLVSRPRGSRGGGVAILMRKSFHHVQVKHSFSSFECVETLITLKSSNPTKLGPKFQPLRLLGVYRPPSSSLSDFFDEFESLLHDLSERPGEVVISGDFNIHVQNTSSGSTKTFLGLLDDHHFHQHVSKPTHIAGGTLDLVLAKTLPGASPISNVNVEMIPAVPDHAMVSFTLENGVATKRKKFVLVKKRDMKSLDIEQLTFSILQSPLCDIENFPSEVEEIIGLYDEMLAQFFDELAPITEMVVPEDPGPKWYNTDCQAAKRRRRKAERQYQVTLEKSVCPDKLWDSLRTKRDEAKAATKFIIAVRCEFYRKKLEEAGGDMQKSYRIMNGLLGKDGNSSVLPEYTDLNELCQRFIDFFQEKINKIYQEIEAMRADTEEVSGPEDENIPPKFDSFRPVSSDELVKVIRSMNYKICDLDPMPSKLVGTCVHELIPIIKAIVNGSLTNGVFPSVLKKAVIRPVYKGKGLDSNDVGSYRPISNLSFISKIIEKCVSIQLTEHLEEHQLFATVQSAYRKKHSCETATLKIFNDLLVMTDKKNKAVLLLLDLSAAFDTVPHTTLLRRLQYKYGVSGTALKWFSSYLEGRKAIVKIGECQSAEVNVNIGVPQGSILGPLMFILFTKDLEKIAAKHGMRIHLYADDSQLYVQFTNNNWSQCEDQLRQCFSEIEQWMASSYLKLNPSKTELLFISSRPDKTANPIGRDESFSLRRSDQPATFISASEQARNLGVIFDERLTMKAHISKVVRDCNMTLHNLRRIGDKLSKKNKVQLVHSLIHSRLDYCNGLLIGADKGDIARLQKVQNAATRFIFGRWQWRGVTELRRQLHFLPVTARIDYKICLMVFKCINNLSPSYLQSLLQREQPKYKSLRHDPTLLQKDFSTKLKTSQRAFQVAGPRLWNILPESIRSCTDETLFKSRLKTHLFDRSYGPAG